MSTWQAFIGVFAGLISLLGYLPYIVMVLKKKTTPNRATWWIWTIIGFILVASYYSSGATNTIWLPVCAAFSQLIIAIVSIKYGEGGLNRFDQICLLGAALSLLLWWHYNSPIIALFINIAMDFFGALPTIKKSYYQPKTEEPLPWIIFLVASIVNFFALQEWTFILLVYPLCYFFDTAIIVLLLLRSKLKFRLYPRNRVKRQNNNSETLLIRKKRI